MAHAVAPALLRRDEGRRVGLGIGLREGGADEHAVSVHAGARAAVDDRAEVRQTLQQQHLDAPGAVEHVAESQGCQRRPGALRAAVGGQIPELLGRRGEGTRANGPRGDGGVAHHADARPQGVLQVVELQVRQARARRRTDREPHEERRGAVVLEGPPEATAAREEDEEQFELNGGRGKWGANVSHVGEGLRRSANFPSVAQ